jgi:hypothetical protein
VWLASTAPVLYTATVVEIGTGASWQDLTPQVTVNSSGVITSVSVMAGGTITLDTYTLPPLPPIAPSFPNSPLNGAAVVGFPYSYAYTVVGSPAPTFSLVSGVGTGLPPGLGLSTTGTISGTPNSGDSGAYTGEVQATNSSGSVSQGFTITVSAPHAPAITSSTQTVSATAGVSCSFTITATGAPTPTFTILNGELPLGLSLSQNGSNGVISGTPDSSTVNNTYTITVDAGNGVLPDATQAFTISINASQAPAFVNGPPPQAFDNQPYYFPYICTGSPTPTFLVTTGSLPKGLSLSLAGVISGTPTGIGSSTGTVTASNGVLPNATQNFTMIPAIGIGTAAVITNGPPPTTGSINTAYSFTYKATGTPTPTFGVTAGSLPPGLSLNVTTGLLSGQPNTGGVFTGTVSALNGVTPAPNASQNFTITVDQAPAFINGPPPATAAVGNSYYFAYAVSGYPASTFSLTGSLPPGLSLNTATGVISGAPTTGGVYTATVTASNGTSPNATQTLTITVDEAPSITNGPPPATATNSVPYSFTYTVSGYPASTFSLNDGSFPPGLNLTTDGVLSGIPTTDGVYTGTVIADNGTDQAAQGFTITVTDAAPTDTPTMPPWGLALLTALLAMIAGKSLPKPAPVPVSSGKSDS